MDREVIVKKYEPVQDNLLLILHELQDNRPGNYLTTDDLSLVSRYLKLNKSAVYGVVEYYSMFSLKPRGKYIIRLCISPVCRLMGSTDMKSHLETMLGIKMGETTPDGVFSLEHSECLGQCALAPALMINRDVVGLLTEEKLKKIIAEKRGEMEEGNG